MRKITNSLLVFLTALSCLTAAPMAYAEESEPVPTSQPSASADVTTASAEPDVAEEITIATALPSASEDAAQETPAPSAEATPEIKEEPDEETASPQASALPEFSAAPSAAAPSAEPEAAATPTPDAAPGLPRKIMRAPVNSQHATGYIEDLSDDDEYIEMFRILEQQDGTPFDHGNGKMWDDNDDPGNDSGPNNNVVMTYDTINYTLQLTSAPYTDGAYYRHGYIRFRMVLPASETEASFVTGDMGWMVSGTGTDYDWKIVMETIDGNECQVLYCSMYLSADAAGTPNVFPCVKQTANVSIEIKNMKNGDYLQPKFFCWMDHNETNGICSTHGKDEVMEADSGNIRISAKPSYNIVIGAQGHNPTMTMDFSNGNATAPNKELGKQHGTNFVFGAMLELRNDGTCPNKMLKGVEAPTGNIAYDIDASYFFIKSDGSRIDITDDPDVKGVIFCAEPNGTNEMGRDEPSEPYAVASWPGGNGRGDIRYSLYSHGDWAFDSHQLSMNLSTYTIDDTYFPASYWYGGFYSSTYYNWQDYGKGARYTRRGIFSVYQYDIALLYDTNTLLGKYGDGSIGIQCKLKEISTTSLSGSKDRSNVITGDDAASSSAPMHGPGSYTHMMHYSSYERGYEYNVQGRGPGAYAPSDDVGIIGQKFLIYSQNSIADSESNYHVGDDRLVKFDASAFTPVNNDPGSRIVYAAKKDGTDWVNDDEKSQAKIEDLVYYKTYNELISDGKKCVGFLVSWRKSNTSWWCNGWVDNVSIVAQINPDMSLQKTVHSIETYSRVYSVDLTKYENPSLPIKTWRQTIEAGLTQPDLPDYVSTYICRNGTYVKASYNTDTDTINSWGTNDWVIGDSMYIEGYTASITKSTAQSTNGSAKTVYNLDNGEKIVDYQLSPYINMATPISMTTEVTVTDTIPAGMSYNNDAVYGGTYVKGVTDGAHGSVKDGTAIDAASTKITKNSDGTTTVAWTLHNVDISKSVPVIYYSATIDVNAAANAKTYTSQASVKTTEDQRPPIAANVNTSDFTISVVKLSGFSITKLSDKEQYEVPDDISWTMTWNNLSKNKEENDLMMDMMPYNGDSFGSDYHGSYTVKALKLKLDDPSKYTFVYTLDPAYRGKTTRDISTADALSSWTKGTIAADGTVADLNGKTPVAWGIVGTLDGNTSLQGNIVIQTSGARADDDYYNGSTMMKAVVSGHSAYVSHNISGYAFLDANKNSRKDDGETMLPGITVTLYPAGSRSNPVKTIDGANCVTSTDSSGFYEFKNVARGDYDAVFSGGDLPALRMTSAGANNTGWTSKASKEENSGNSEHAAIVEHVVDKAVEAAQKDVLSKITYRVDYTHINAGFYLSDFPKSKAIYNDAGKDINQRYVKDAQTLTYKITFRNLINAEQTFRIADAVPANTKFISADNGGTLADGTVTWDSIKVPAHGTGTVSFKVKAIGKQDTYVSIDNIANVWMLDGTGKPIAYIDPKTNTTHNQVRPDIALHKQVQDIGGKDMDKLYVQKDDVLVYVLTVKNGDIPFKGTLSDKIPVGMSFLSADNTGANADGTVTWAVDLKAGETKKYSFRVHVDQKNGDFENTGILTDGVAPDLKSNTVYNQAAVITIRKKILNYYSAFGDPSFLFEIKGSDGTVSYRMIAIPDPKAGASGSAEFSIPAGTAEGTFYDVAEMRNARYAFVSANSSSPIVRKISDNLLRVTPIKVQRSADLGYENQIEDWGEFSHEAAVSNHVNVGH